MLEDFSLITGRDLVPLPDVLEIASLVRLGAFLVVEGEERTQLFSRSLGNNSAIGVPSLHRNKPAFVKPLAAGFTFCFFPFRSRAGVPGGEASGLAFEAPATSATGGTAFARVGFASRGVKAGTVVGTEPSMM